MKWCLPAVADGCHASNPVPVEERLSGPVRDSLWGHRQAVDMTDEMDTNNEENINDLEGTVREEVLGLGNSVPFSRRCVSLKPSRVIQETQRADRATFFGISRAAPREIHPSKNRYNFEKEVLQRKNLFMAHLLMVLWNESHRDLYLAIRKRVETINGDMERLR